MIELKVDINAFDERTAGDLALKRDLLACFEKEFVDLEKSLKNTSLAQDFAGMSSNLHKLKSSVGIFGFDNVTKFIENMENRIACRDFSDNADILAELLHSIREHIKELKKYIN